MSVTDTQTLWLRLTGAGLASGAMPPARALPVPWFVRLMQGFAGWIGALFVLMFAGAAFSALFDSTPAGLLIGCMACGAAGMLFRLKPDSDFMGQFGLAVSLAGQMLVMFALGRALQYQLGPASLLIAVFQAILFVALPHPAHRVWSAWASAMALMLAANFWHWQNLAPPLLGAACAALWLNEARWPRQAELARAGGYGLALALIVTLAFTQGGSASELGFLLKVVPVRNGWLGPILNGLVLVATLWQLLERARIGPRSPVGTRLLAVAAILAVTTWKAPGLVPAVLILVLGFAGGERPLFALGVLALLSYMGIYYYSLEASLLFKATLMLGTGALLLAVRLVVLRGWAIPAEHPAHD